MTEKPSKPAPLELGPDEQQDDNIDDMGRKKGGDKHDQPVEKPPAKPAGE